MTLVGRAAECAAVDEVLAAARDGRSRTLVIRGDAGIGKTALIDYAVDEADDFLVVRFTGFESERDLGFAALHRLLTPILHQIERLPPPQRDALSSALGLAAGPPANRFLVGLGVISLAANAARARSRLLCVIDDAHWVDRESIEALAFWGRRIEAEGIALVFGERSGPGGASALGGFPTLEVGNLSADDARSLLLAQTGPRFDRQVADRIVAETGGNPLALVELVKDLSVDRLIGAAAVPQPLPLNRRLEERFAQQARSLPGEAQMLLLVAAANSTGDGRFLWEAASLLGLDANAIQAAEAAGLVVVGSNVVFRHPLIRSAVYAGASPADRRAVHKALAETDPEVDSERRAWHLAGASIGAEEQVAANLERCAERAAERGSHTAELALRSRSAELTPDPERAAERRVAAAEAALASAAPKQAHALVALATPHLRNAALGARAQRVAGLAWARNGSVATAAPLLLASAVELSETDPHLGREVLLEALEAATISGNLRAADHDVTQAIAAAADASRVASDAPVDLFLDAFATYVSVGFVAAVPLLRAAVTAVREQDLSADELLRWAVLVSNATRALWDQGAHEELMTRLAQAGREQAALSRLYVALWATATGETWTGRLGAADAHYAEAADILSVAGESAPSGELMAIEMLAIRGRDTEAQAKAAVVMAVAEQLNLGSAVAMIHSYLATLDLGMGRYGDALSHAVEVFERDPITHGNQVLPDMVEAAVRAGEAEAAKKALDRLEERATASGTPWAMGLLARSRALVAGDAAEPLHRQAIDLLGSTRMAVETARAHLLYGEWLRRQKRRIDAREHLRTAYESFATMGTQAFATRARDELQATGERARKRSHETSFDLTPQEAHVAQLAATGATNSEIAAQLFISTNTVEYHLRKVFRKLSITSRRQLRVAGTTDVPGFDATVSRSS